MKKNIPLFIALICALNLTAQNFTEHHVFDESKITGLHEMSELFDFDGDGDDDLLVAGGYNRGPENANKILVFVNDGNDLDSVHVLYTSPFGIGTSSSIVVADFDNDKDSDILFNSGFNLYILENLGNGVYASPVIHTIPVQQTAIWKITSGDFDNDNLIDIIYTNTTQVFWCKNLDNLSFQDPISLFTTDSLNLYFGHKLTTITPTNLDGDLDLDFIIYTNGNGHGNILLACTNDGSGNFSQSVIKTDYFNVNSYAVEDFNGDGFKDIGSVSYADDRATIYWNNQTNNFSSSTIIDEYTNPTNSTSSIKYAGFYSFDYDNDNDMDVLICKRYGTFGGGGELFLNNGSGIFTPSGKRISNTSFKADQNAGELVNEVFTSDVNKDGRLDIITTSNEDADIILHLQNSDSTFDSSHNLSHHMKGISRVQFIDIDGDNIKDVVTIDGLTHGEVNASYNDGKGNFTSQKTISDNLGYYAKDVIFTDWDKDGKMDKITCNSNILSLHSNFQESDADSTIWIYTSNTISPFGDLGTDGKNMHTLRLGDVDNDGDDDLIVAESENTKGIKVHWVENKMGLAYEFHTLVNAKVISYEIGDMDGDQDLDFVSLEFDGSNNRVFKTYHFDQNTKTFSLFQTKPFTFNNGLSVFVLADPDNDNDLDIVYPTLTWLENTDGLGTLEDPIEISGTFNQYDKIISGDVNKDGLVDFVVTKFGGGTLKILNLHTNLGGNTFSTTTISDAFEYGSAPALIVDVDYDGVNDIITYEYAAGSMRPKWYRTCYPTYSSITETACGNYTSPSGNYTWDESNTYVDTIPNAFGCDSIITIDLTIINNDNSVSVNGETITANQLNSSYKWLDCNNNYTELPSETEQSFSASVNGNYALEISQDECTDTSECITILITNISSDAVVLNFSIYPIPAKEVLQVSGLDAPFEYSIYDNTSRIITNGYSNNMIDISNIETGMYNLVLFSNGKQKAIKFVISD